MASATAVATSAARVATSGSRHVASNTIDALRHMVRSSQKLVVITGAGISTDSGTRPTHPSLLLIFYQ